MDIWKNDLGHCLRKMEVRPMKVARLPKTFSSIFPRFMLVAFGVVITTGVKETFPGCFLQRKL